MVSGRSLKECSSCALTHVLFLDGHRLPGIGVIQLVIYGITYLLMSHILQPYDSHNSRVIINRVLFSNRKPCLSHWLHVSSEVFCVVNSWAVNCRSGSLPVDSQGGATAGISAVQSKKQDSSHQQAPSSSSSSSSTSRPGKPKPLVRERCVRFANYNKIAN